MTAGLAAVFIEAPSEAQQTMQIPQVMKDQCASLDIAAEGVRNHSPLLALAFPDYH